MMQDRFDNIDRHLDELTQLLTPIAKELDREPTTVGGAGIAAAIVIALTSLAISVVHCAVSGTTQESNPTINFDVPQTEDELRDSRIRSILETQHAQP